MFVGYAAACVRLPEIFILRCILSSDLEPLQPRTLHEKDLEGLLQAWCRSARFNASCYHDNF